jgi:DNA-binding TFAR19-related protein (PDSD5 family)
VNSRTEALAVRLERIERELASLARGQREQSGAVEEIGDALARDVQPALRAILDEEAANRRRLYAARASEDYAAAFEDRRALVSIVLATRGRRELFERALPSLLAQTHEELEVVVVGDAAPAQLARELAAVGDRRVSFANLTQRIVAHEDPHRHWLVGSTMARNEAARRARGRWLLHFDDDDSLRPDALTSLLALAREERVEVAYGGFEQHDPAGGATVKRAFPPEVGSFGWQGALVHRGLAFFERELVAGALGIAGDMYLLERTLRAGVRFAMLDATVWDYFPSALWNRSSDEQTSSQTSSTSQAASSE